MTTPTAHPTRRDDAFSPTMQRVAAASGLAAALLILISAFGFSGETPGWSESPAAFADYFRDDGDKVQVGSVLLLLVAVEVLWFTGYLRGELGRAEMAARGFTRVANVVVPAGALIAAGLTIVAAMDAAIAELAMTDTNPEIIRALYNLDGGFFLLVAVGAIVMMTATSLAILALRVAPKWLAIVGFIGSLAYFVVLFVALNPSNDDNALGIGFPVGFLMLVIWLAGLSITFLRRIGKDEPVA